MAFCEGKYGGVFRGVKEEKGHYLPEWGNSISALFIAYVGFHIAYFWDHDSMLLRLIASLFFVNGWSSFAYHSTGILGTVDGNTMMLNAWLTLGFMFEELVDTTLKRADLRFRCEWILKLRGLGWLATMSLAWWQMGGAPWGGKEYEKDLFELMFGIPMALIIMLAFYVSKFGKNWVASDFVTVEMATACTIRMNWGLAFATVAALSWYFTEKSCEEVEFFRWFPGHLVWHIFMSWGLLQVLQFCALLRADNYHAYPGPVITTEPFKKFKDWYFYIFPSLVFYADSEKSDAAQRRLLRISNRHEMSKHVRYSILQENGFIDKTTSSRSQVELESDPQHQADIECCKPPTAHLISLSPRRSTLMSIQSKATTDDCQRLRESDPQLQADIECCKPPTAHACSLSPQRSTRMAIQSKATTDDCQRLRESDPQLQADIESCKPPTAHPYSLSPRRSTRMAIQSKATTDECQPCGPQPGDEIRVFSFTANGWVTGEVTALLDSNTICVQYQIEGSWCTKKLNIHSQCLKSLSSTPYDEEHDKMQLYPEDQQQGQSCVNKKSLGKQSTQLRRSEMEEQDPEGFFSSVPIPEGQWYSDSCKPTRFGQPEHAGWHQVDVFRGGQYLCSVDTPPKSYETRMSTPSNH